MSYSSLTRGLLTRSQTATPHAVWSHWYPGWLTLELSSSMLRLTPFFLGVRGDAPEAVGDGLDGLDLGLIGLPVAAEADQAGDPVFGGDVDRGLDLGLDPVVVRALVEAIGQRAVPHHAGDRQVVPLRGLHYFLEIVAAPPQLDGGVADVRADAE